MSEYKSDIPEVVVKRGKMFHYWSVRMKVGALMMAFIIYIYILLFIKTVYMKNQRLDRIMAMVVETEKMMHKVHTVDQNLALKVERLEEFYANY